jgi:hypothetical protein
MIVKRYFEEDCLTSSPGKGLFEIYFLLRIYKTWVTEKQGFEAGEMGAKTYDRSRSDSRGSSKEIKTAD